MSKHGPGTRDLLLLLLGPLLGLLLHSTAAKAAAGPITKGPWVQRVTSDSAIVRVEVDPPAPVSLDMGDSDAGHRVIASPEVRSLHAINVNGLQPGTRYAYSVRAGSVSKLASFTTAPRDDTPFRFLAYGDNRNDDAAHAAVVRAMVPVTSDFLVHTGDFVEDGRSLAQWQTFFDIEAPLLGARCLFSAVGNHELTDGAGIEYARFFGPTDPPPGSADRPKGAPAATRPEHLDGTFRWGNTRLFFINGMVSFKGTVDRSWLEKALADSDAETDVKWRVVVVHHGPWSSGPHGNNAHLLDAGIPALLKAHKVDLVLSGHDHIYERGWAEGLAYIVTGGGGAPVYKIKKKLPQARKVEAARHFVEVNVSATSMQVVATRMDGSTLERCALIRKADSIAGWDCDAPGSGSENGGGVGSGASTPGEAPAAPSTSRCACRAAGGSRPGGGVTVALLLFGLLLGRRSRTS